ncbi:MAG: hypothetical protein ABL870_08300 [Sediminibacterium sp.]
MDYSATIIKFDFKPMVDIVPSNLFYWVRIEQTNFEVMLEEEGSIDYLSRKYGFKIESDSQWDFSGFEGRRCIVRKDDIGYRFIRFL